MIIITDQVHDWIARENRISSRSTYFFCCIPVPCPDLSASIPYDKMFKLPMSRQINRLGCGNKDRAFSLSPESMKKKVNIPHAYNCSDISPPALPYLLLGKNITYKTCSEILQEITETMLDNSTRRRHIGV